jgi:DNA-binding GntR family transcriptional regulator
MDALDATRSAPAPAIPRESLHDKVVARLRDMIVEGELAAGSRISERDLCLSFGISRTPLREALKVLAREGLIDLLPHRGARVAQLGPGDIEDMFQVMAALEALSGRLACERITDAELGEIRALHFEMLACHARRNLPDYFRLNQAIHEAILDAARNPVLAASYRSLAGRIRRARYMANMSDTRWREAVEEHAAILAALEARDGTRLARLLAEHLAHKSEAARQALTDGTPMPRARGRTRSKAIPAVR